MTNSAWKAGDRVRVLSDGRKGWIERAWPIYASVRFSVLGPTYAYLYENLALIEEKSPNDKVPDTETLRLTVRMKALKELEDLGMDELAKPLATMFSYLAHEVYREHLNG